MNTYDVLVPSRPENPQGRDCMFKKHMCGMSQYSLETNESTSTFQMEASSNEENPFPLESTCMFDQGFSGQYMYQYNNM